MTSRNYELALDALDKIEKPDDVVLESAQVLAFNHAVDLFQNNQLAAAMSFFQRSRAYGIDLQLVAESFFGKVKSNTAKANMLSPLSRSRHSAPRPATTSARCMTSQLCQRLRPLSQQGICRGTSCISILPQIKSRGRRRSDSRC